MRPPRVHLLKWVSTCPAAVSPWRLGDGWGPEEMGCKKKKKKEADPGTQGWDHFLNKKKALSRIMVARYECWLGY